MANSKKECEWKHDAKDFLLQLLTGLLMEANDKNTFRKKPPPAYRFRYKIPKNKASFAVQPLWLTIESERNFENRYNLDISCQTGTST